MPDTPSFQPIRQAPQQASKSSNAPDPKKFKEKLEEEEKKVGHAAEKEQKKKHTGTEKTDQQSDLETGAPSPVEKKVVDPIKKAPPLKLKEGKELVPEHPIKKLDDLHPVEGPTGELQTEEAPPPKTPMPLHKNKPHIVNQQQNVPLEHQTPHIDTDSKIDIGSKKERAQILTPEEQRTFERNIPKQEMPGNTPLEDYLLQDIRKEEAPDKNQAVGITESHTLKKVGEEARKVTGVTQGDDVTGRIAPPPPQPTVGYSSLSKEVQKMYDLMVGSIMVIQETHKKEVRVTLNLPTDSILNGTEIVVQEFATAKNQFNIELYANPQALNSLQKNLPMLQKAFAEGNYNFKVQRLEVTSRGT